MVLLRSLVAVWDAEGELSGCEKLEDRREIDGLTNFTFTFDFLHHLLENWCDYDKMLLQLLLNHFFESLNLLQTAILNPEDNHWSYLDR